MNHNIVLFLVLLLGCTTSDSFAAAPKIKRDSIDEKYSKNERLSKLLETSEDTIYYYKDSIKKVVSQDNDPRYLTRIEDADGTIHFSSGTPKKTDLQENKYTFWISKLDKPHMRGKRPGVLKNIVASTTKWQVDCDKNTYSTPTSSFYDAKGEQIKSFDSSTSMKEVVPGSITEGIVYFMCIRMVEKVIPEGLPSDALQK